MDIKATTTVLMGVGIIIILLCVLPFRNAFWVRLRETKQKFKGFGIELEVSAMPLFFFVGVLLTLASFFLYIKDYEGMRAKLQADYEKMKQDKESLQRVIEEGKRYDILASLQFSESEAPNFPSLKNLECSYSTWNRSEDSLRPVSEVIPGATGSSLRVRIRELERGDFITVIQVVNKSDKSRWVFEEPYNPVEPAFKMKRKGP